MSESRNSFISPFLAIILRSSILVAGCFILALPSLAQDQNEPALGSNSGLTLFQERTLARPGELSNNSCDLPDLQTGQCEDGAGGSSARGTAAKLGSLRSNELVRSPRASLERTFSGANIDQPQLSVDQPTEFQAFIQTSIGQMLPIYGAALFKGVPSTYAPLDRVPIAPDYIIGPGDELDVRLWGQISSEQRLVVDRTGDIFIPQVGRIAVAGLHFSDLPAALRVSIGRVFRNFELSVNMGQLRSIQVFVMGRAQRPGTYTVSSLSTLVNALFVSGGPSPQGSMRNIQLKRGEQVVTRFDMYDLLLRGDKSKDAALKPGDVIFIPPAGARVALSGSIETPAIYEIEQHCSLREILEDAGGLSPVAAGQHAVLERIDNRSTLVAENIQLSGAGLDTQVQNGDIISLLKVIPQFAKTVSLKGNVADPVRLPWHEGMRVSDLIPEKQALLTRDYWAQRNRLTAGSGVAIREVRNTAGDTSLAASSSGNFGDSIQKFKNKNDLQPPAPEINWSYAAIERQDVQTLSTHLIPFNLRKAVIEHEEASDMLLRPGDVVNVFSAADFTTTVTERARVVKLEGEVKVAGLYSVAPNETLRQLVARAGGLTDRAYLYGAEFNRESTKREQQKRLNDYLDRVEKEMDQNASTLSGRTSTVGAEAMARLSLERQHAALERLRDEQSTGRIVMELKADSQGVSALPDLPLEDGDRLLVPGVPATVNVMGTVYNQATFLYTANSNIRDYLKLSGGPTKYGDFAHMFVIRADGAVTLKTNRSRLESMAAEPGDTVVVPLTLAKNSKMRDLLDWAQIFSGFGIAAAAVNVLK